MKAHSTRTRAGEARAGQGGADPCASVDPSDGDPCTRVHSAPAAAANFPGACARSRRSIVFG
ncbi:MAG: hypothetical protein JW751_22725, partial [Polyangiaceae bacterium]|nr:hypothetical protein [Polyangiaceae bacterium]